MGHDLVPPEQATLDCIRDEFRHDPETGELFRRVGTLSIDKKTGDRRMVVNIKGRTCLLSHVIWFLEHGRWPKTMLDHANRDSCDDRPTNLRETTHGGNLANSKHRKRPLPTGVYAKHGRFQARISVKGCLTTLGSFDTPEEAEKCFKNAHLAKFGEHSRYFEGERRQRFS